MIMYVEVGSLASSPFLYTLSEITTYHPNVHLPFLCHTCQQQKSDLIVLY